MTTPTTVSVRLQLRADTAANWTSANPTLLANELGRETDTGKIKIGDGSTAWSSLAYQAWATLPIAVASGGTGQTSYTNGQLLIGNTTGNTLTKATLTAGSGIAITNGTGSITVAASGISDAQIAADAEIAVSKLADGTARQLLQTDAAGTGVEWASNIDIPGTLDVTSAATFDSTIGASAGTASLPSITFTGDLNTGIYSPGADQVAISTGGSGRLFVDASGRVGVGGTPGTTLDVNGGFQVTGSVTGYSAGEVRLGGTGSNIDSAISTQASGSPILFFDHRATSNTGIFAWRNGTGAGSERMRLDGSGCLLVGTSTSTENVRYEQNFSFVKTGANTFGGGSFVGYSGTSAEYAPLVDFKRSRGTTDGSMTVVASGDRLGGIAFLGADGNSFEEAANIRCYVDGTPGDGDMPGRLVFSTTADGASSPTERLRISNGGYLYHRGPDFGAQFSSNAAAGTTSAIISAGHSASSITASTISFRIWTNGDVVNTNNSYGAISDIKLKENIVDANSQWDDLKALQVRKYNFKEDQTHTQIGLIAQEVELVSPGLVTESPDRDAEDNDLGTVTKSVNYSVLYMKAVKALQEAMERIETLEAKVAALESA